MYFRIANDCKLITGQQGGIIYNFGIGQTKCLTIEQTTLLKELENNLPILEAIRKTNIDENEAIKFIRYLAAKGYGFINTNPVFIDRFEYTRHYNIPGLIEPSVSVHTAYLNINSKCILNCKHCTSGWRYRRGCNTCLPWRPSKENEPVNNQSFLEKAIWKLGELNCRRLILSGGDPLQNPDLIKRLSLVAQNAKITEALVITSGLNLLNNSVKPLIEQKLFHPIICMFGADEKSFKHHTNDSTHFSQIIRGLEWLKAKKYKFSISITIYRDEMTVKETLKQYGRIIKKFRPWDLYSVEICPNKYSNEKFNIDIRPDPFIKIDEFEYRSRFHPCLGYTVAIDNNGDIFPCPHLNKDLVGNLNQSDLEIIIYEHLFSKYWNLTKDRIHPCSKCEIRYSCNDCRVSDRTDEDIDRMIYCEKVRRLYQQNKEVLL